MCPSVTLIRQMVAFMFSGMFTVSVLMAIRFELVSSDKTLQRFLEGVYAKSRKLVRLTLAKMGSVEHAAKIKTRTMAMIVKNV